MKMCCHWFCWSFLTLSSCFHTLPLKPAEIRLFEIVGLHALVCHKTSQKITAPKQNPAAPYKVMGLGHSSTPRDEVSKDLNERALGGLSKNRSWKRTDVFEQVVFNFKTGITVVVRVMSWHLGLITCRPGPRQLGCFWHGANFCKCPGMSLIAGPAALWRDGDGQLCCAWGCRPSPSAREQHMLCRAASSTAGPTAAPLLTAHLQTSVSSYPGTGCPCSTVYGLTTQLVSLKMSRTYSCSKILFTLTLCNWI